MKLDTEFCKLPLRFDAARLAEEVAQFAPGEWRVHPQGHAGNSAVPLIAVHGDPTNDSVKGPMQSTPALARCPYLRQVLASVQSVLGRTRLMRIIGNGEATAHVDTNYYWMQRVRVHVPIVTDPEVQFQCNDRSIHMAPGETWIFDTWKLHNVINPTPRDRIHLVADTVGSAEFWDLVAAAERPFAPEPQPPQPASFIPYDPNRSVQLETEAVNFPVVMTPWEQEALLVRFFEEARQSDRCPEDETLELEALLERFYRQWRCLWARHGDAAPGWPKYKQLLDQLDTQLAPFAERIYLPNNLEAVETIRQAIIRSSLNPELAGTGDKETRKQGDKETRNIRVPVKGSPGPVNGLAAVAPPRFDRPIFIVAAPRSGSTLLFETLARSPGVWTVGGESHEVFELIPKLNPLRRGCDSNRLTAADYDAETAATLRNRFLELLRDRDGRPPPAGAVRLLEKTPKNALRIPFLDVVFPEALFIYLYREPHENLSSILEAWRSGGFVTYPRLPEWEGLPWSLLLIPEWRQLRGQPLPEIAAAQWMTANRCILDDLEQLPEDRWCLVSYADLVADPQTLAERLCRFAGVTWDQQLRGPLPLSRHTLTPPVPNKWRKNEAELAMVLPRAEAVAARVRAVATAHPPPQLASGVALAPRG
jgi:hypothetical protein